MLKNKVVIIILLGIFILGLLIFGIFYFQNLTGNALLDLELNSKEGENPEGIIKLSLKEGELIPASSKIVFENDGKRYEYLLSELVSEELSEGSYYVEGTSISGEGSGYGVLGEAEESTDVSFNLDVLTKKSSSDLGEENSTEEIIEETSKELVSEENSTEENLSEETVKENEVSTEKISEDAVEKVSEETIEETSKEEIVEEVIKEDKKEKESKEKNDKEESVEETPSEEPTITGNIIGRLFGFTSNFFLGITGQVSLEIENEVEGKVSLDNEFVYDLKEGQTAEIVKGSVKTTNEELSDDDIKLKIKDNQAIVTTSYSKKKKGFGKDYIKDNSKVIAIQLPNLNLTMGENLKTSLVYGDEEIISLNVILEEGNIKAENKTISDKKLENKILGLNTTLDKKDLSLNNEEKSLLSDEFGNVALKTTKAELVDDKIKIRYEIGDYWIEYSYNSNIPNEELDFLMGTDRVKFLKDLSKKLSEEKINKERLNEFLVDYEMFSESGEETQPEDVSESVIDNITQ